MSQEEIAVEKKVETAATQQKTGDTSTQNPLEVDYEAELTKANDKISKISEERDNYRRGMLKAKGKLPEEDDNSSNGEDIDAKIDRVVKERLLAESEARAQAEKDALVLSLAKRNKELTLALKNKGQASSSSGIGSNQEQPEGKTDNLISNDQVNALKARGWDDKKIEEFKKNIVRVNQTPK